MKEEAPKKALENPGGNEYMAELGGADAGLPFFAFLDAAGKKIADSKALPGGQNIGDPASSEELRAFEQLLRRAAPKMAAADVATVIAHFRKAAPPQR